MRRYVAIVPMVLVLILIYTPTSAQQTPSSEALQAADDLAKITSADMTDQMSRELSARIWPQLENKLGTRIDKATVAELHSEFDRLLGDFSNQARSTAPALYARYFSAQELHDITAFYQTPTGTKALQLMPKITTEYMTSTLLPLSQQFNRKLHESMTSILKKHGYENTDRSKKSK
jgi:uncharacterized protein